MSLLTVLNLTLTLTTHHFTLTDPTKTDPKVFCLGIVEKIIYAAEPSAGEELHLLFTVCLPSDCLIIIVNAFSLHHKAYTRD